MIERRRWFGTVRWRVTAAATCVVAAVLVVASVLLTGLQRRVLVDQLDDGLRADAAAIVAQLRADPTILRDSSEESEALRPSNDDDAVAQVVNADGDVIIRSDEAPSSRIGELPDDAGDIEIDDARVDDDADEDNDAEDDEVENESEDDEVDEVENESEGDSVRVVAQRVKVGDDDVIVVVAAPRDDADEAVRSLTTASLVAVPAVTVLLGGLVWLLVGRTLRPVEQIRRAAAAIGQDELHRRVPEPASDDEIARLAATVNAMLARLEASAKRERRFTGDASHELRTPLTRMRAELEVARRAADDDAPLVDSLLEDVVRMQDLVGDLLVLARSDGSSTTTAGRLVDLDDIVLAEIADTERGAIEIDASAVSGAQVSGSPEQLRRVVRNLLDNAVRHATRTVAVRLSEDPQVELVVVDDGAGIPAGQRDVVFERFTRLDDARSAASGGAGLGLAIVREVVRNHGGDVTIRDDGSSGATFVVALPRAEVHDPHRTEP